VKQQQASLETATKKLDMTIKVDDNATKIIENAFSEKKKFEDATGERYPADLFRVKMDSARSLYKAIGRDIDPSQFETVADFKQAKKVDDETVLTSAYADFLKNPSAEGAATLEKMVRKAKVAYGAPDHTYKVIEDSVTKFNEQRMKPQERPYKVGQRLPGRNVGDKEVTEEVIGFNDDGTPQTRVVGEAPRYKPNQVTLSPAQTATIAHQLRTTVKNNPYVKDFQDVDTKYNVMLKAMDTSKKSKNMIAVDQSLITLFNKMTDPQSVVRESEYARTPENMSLINSIKGKVEKIQKGGAGLTAVERQALTDMAKQFYQVYATRYNEVLQDTDYMATLQGINPKLVTGQYRRRDSGAASGGDRPPNNTQQKFQILKVY
jgi:hypothetical protein